MNLTLPMWCFPASLRESFLFSHIPRGTSALNLYYTFLQNIVFLVSKTFQWAAGLIHAPNHMHVFYTPAAPSAGSSCGAKARASWHPAAQSHPENGIKLGLKGNFKTWSFMSTPGSFLFPGKSLRCLENFLLSLGTTKVVNFYPGPVLCGSDTVILMGRK